MNTSYLFLADGFEEIEALTVVDVMRRAGMSVATVSVNATAQVTGAHAVKVMADMVISDVNGEGAEWLICPGGMPGATNLAACTALSEMLGWQFHSGGKIAAICAAPAVVLGRAGLLKGHKATCYPGFEGDLIGAEYEDRAVVADDKFVLGNGPANALVWALAIVDKALGNDRSRGVANGMLLYPCGNDNFDFLFG